MCCAGVGGQPPQSQVLSGMAATSSEDGQSDEDAAGLDLEAHRDERAAGLGPLVVRQDEDVDGVAARDYDRAGERLDDARERLTEAIQAAITGGLSAYRVAQITGLSERHVGRLRTDAR